jgi:hypothetical protein
VGKTENESAIEALPQDISNPAEASVSSKAVEVKAEPSAINAKTIKPGSAQNEIQKSNPPSLPSIISPSSTTSVGTKQDGALPSSPSIIITTHHRNQQTDSKTSSPEGSNFDKSVSTPSTTIKAPANQNPSLASNSLAPNVTKTASVLSAINTTKSVEMAQDSKLTSTVPGSNKTAASATTLAAQSQSNTNATGSTSKDIQSTAATNNVANNTAQSELQTTLSQDEDSPAAADEEDTSNGTAALPGMMGNNANTTSKAEEEEEENDAEPEDEVKPEEDYKEVIYEYYEDVPVMYFYCTDRCNLLCNVVYRLYRKYATSMMERSSR